MLRIASQIGLNTSVVRNTKSKAASFVKAFFSVPSIDAASKLLIDALGAKLSNIFIIAVSHSDPELPLS